MKIRSTALHRVNYQTLLPLVGAVTFDENREITVEDADLAAQLVAMEGLELVDAEAFDAAEAEITATGFEAMSLKEMQALAVEAGIPAEEFKRFTAKKDMIAFLNEKLK